MANDITDAEARLALRSIEERRRQVIAEIDMPRWYWWGLALGWIGLGFVTDLGHPWVDCRGHTGLRRRPTPGSPRTCSPAGTGRRSSASGRT